MGEVEAVMMSDPAEEFAELALSLHDEPTLGEAVERVLEFALKALNASYAGIVFVHKHKHVETFAATHPVVEALDKVQFETGEGPDIELVEDRHTVVISDTLTERRWPGWVSQVAANGIRSMMGARLYTTGTTIGSLNVYDERPDHFTQTDQDVAHILARHAAVALDSVRDTENLHRAIDGRGLIGQAQGILMERFAIDADQAFGVLRRYSQNHNVKLHDVAVRLIATRRLPD